MESRKTYGVSSDTVALEALKTFEKVVGPCMKDYNPITSKTVLVLTSLSVLIQEVTAIDAATVLHPTRL